MTDIDRILMALKRSYLYQVNCELTADHSKMLLDLIDGLRAHIAELESERRWIPVSERLPEVSGHFPNDEQELLLLTTDGEISSGYRLAHCFTSPWTDFSNENIAFWMPAPKRPEVQE
jgi:hypothetical protein